MSNSMEEITCNIRLSQFALELRSLRIKKGLNYHNVALACHISVEEILAYETDKKIPTESIKRDLLEFLTK